MLDYRPHTIESAPEASKPTLEAAKAKLGFVPNLMANMAESPVMVESYLTLMGLFDKSRLSEAERQVILMTNNRLNGCTYCMAAHTAAAKVMGVDTGVIQAERVEQQRRALTHGAALARPLQRRRRKARVRDVTRQNDDFAFYG